MSIAKNYFGQFLSLKMVSEDACKVLGEYFSEKPSRVEFFTQKWMTATAKEKERLYLAILAGAPISDCIQWAIDNADFGDWDLSEMGYYYLNDDGSYTPMSWEDYDQWLAKQKEIEGNDPEF